MSKREAPTIMTFLFGFVIGVGFTSAVVLFLMSLGVNHG